MISNCAPKHTIRSDGRPSSPAHFLNIMLRPNPETLPHRQSVALQRPQAIRFDRGKLDEVFSRKGQVAEKRDFLYCGKTPRQGQRIETIIDLEKQTSDQEAKTSRTQVRLSGIVTYVGDLPSFSDWVLGDNFANRLPSCGNCNLRPLLQPFEKVNFVFPVTCINPTCYTNRAAIDNPANYLGIMFQRSLLLHGSLHNQIIVSYNYLNPDSTPKDLAISTFQAGRVYKITLLAQDTIPVFFWKVVSIDDVTTSESFEQLPQAFRDFAYGIKSSGDISPLEGNVEQDGNDAELIQFLNELHEEKMENSVEDQ